MTIKDKIVNYESISVISDRLKHQDKTIIVKTGCFDILHIGHVKMFERCKSKADCLIVLVGSDRVLKELYVGDKSEPTFDESNRSYVVASLESVDYVVLLQEPTHEKALSCIKPDYYHIPYDDKWSQKKQNMCDELNIKLLIESNSVVSNHGQELEPHSSSIK